MPNLDLTTIDRDSGQWALDYAGRLQYYPDDVAAVIGRRYGGENLVSQEQDLTASPWVDHGVVSSTLQTDTPSEGALSESTLIDVTNAFNGRKLSGVLEIGRVYFASAWAKGSTGSESAFLIDSVSGGTNFTVSGSWLRYGQAFAASSTDFVVGVVGAGDSISFTGVVLVDVTAQINPYIPYADIGLSHLTTNASYEHDGVLHELVGCAIKDRPDFDGSSQYVTMGSTYTTELGDNLYIEYVGGDVSEYLVDAPTTHSSRGYIFKNTATSFNAGLGGTMYIDGSATTTDPNDGRTHLLEIRSMSAGKELGVIAARFNVGAANMWSGSVYNVLVTASDGTLKHFWKLDGSAESGITYVGGVPSKLPDPYRGTQLEPDATQDCRYNRDMTNAVWVKTNITPTLIADNGMDNGESSRLEATSANGTVFQTFTDASTNRVYSAYVRRNNGSGTIEMTLDGGASYTDITSLINANTYTPIDIQQTLANPEFGFRIVASGDIIDVDFNQLEDGDLVTSPIENGTGGSLVRDATLLTESITPTKNGITVTIEGFWPYSAEDAPRGTLSSLHNSNNDRLRLEFNGSGQLTLIKYIAGVYQGAATITSPSFAIEEAFKIVVDASPSGISIDLDDGTQTAENLTLVDDFGEGLDTISICSDHAGNNPLPLNVTSASYTVNGGFVSFYVNGRVARRRRVGGG